jgi:hypothetical protein
LLVIAIAVITQQKYFVIAINGLGLLGERQDQFSVKKIGVLKVPQCARVLGVLLNARYSPSACGVVHHVTMLVASVINIAFDGC